MLDENWLKGEDAAALKKTIQYRWAILGAMLFASGIAGWGAVNAIERNEPFVSLSLAIFAAGAFLFFCYFLNQTLAYKHRIAIILEIQENLLQNETVRMLAEIQVHLETAEEDDEL